MLTGTAERMESRLLTRTGTATVMRSTLEYKESRPMNDSALRAMLLGAWELLAWVIEYSDSRDRSWPFGREASGLLLYTPEGLMSAGISRSGRAPFASASARHASAEQKSAAFDGYFHYQGRFRVEAGTVIHEVRESLNPDFSGTRQIRTIELDGDSLVLSAQDLVPGSSVRRSHRLHWRRPGDQRAASV